MNIYSINNITDSIHSTIQVNFIEKELISTPLYNRLHRILQSSMVYLTYPSNKTSRFEHSLGTMHLASQMFYSSLLNADDSVIDSFLCRVDETIRQWVKSDATNGFYSEFLDNSFLRGKGRLERHQDITEIKGALFRKYMPSCLPAKHRFAYIIMLQAVRVAALMHDVGHFPYSHTVEKAIDEIFHTISEKPERNAKEEQFFNCINNLYLNYGIYEIHEIISVKITDTILKNAEQELYHKIAGNDVESCVNKSIISLSFYLARFILTDHNEFFTDIHSIISGVIDADRLDYVCRDTYNSGTRSDRINYDRLIGSMKMVSYRSERGESFYFAFQAKLVRDLEDVLNRRWRIFCDINNHHRVCKTETLLVNVIKNLAGQYFVSGREEARADSMLLSDNISGLWKSIELLEEPSAKTLEYMFIQLDDSWFDTMLKKECYSRYELPLSVIDPLSAQMDEIIANKKHYCSLIKRTIDFIDYDIQIIRHFFSDGQYEELVALSQQILAGMGGQANSPPKTAVERIHDNLTELHRIYGSLCGSVSQPTLAQYPPNLGFFFNSIYGLFADIFVIPVFLQDFDKELEKTIKENVMRECGLMMDCIPKLIKIKTGYNSKRPIQLIDANNKQIPMAAISLEEGSLKNEQKFLPGFYLYAAARNPAIIIRDRAEITDVKKAAGAGVASVMLCTLKTELGRYEDMLQ